jgi:glucokinase
MAARSTVLGIDIGGTKVCLALVSGNGTILSATRYPIAESPAEEIPETLLHHIRAFLASNPDQPPEAIGVGVKAIVGPDGAILRSSVLRSVLPWDLRGALFHRFHLPVALDNDVHAATLAEIRFGAGRNHRDFVYVNIGTGTAAGIVSGGRLARGQRNFAGELGICLWPRGDGEFTTLEGVVSGRGLYEEAVRLRAAYPGSALAQYAKNGRDVLMHFENGDPLAKAAVDRFVETASLMLINLSLLLDPGVFVLGGGVMADPRILKLVKDRIEADSKRFNVSWDALIELSTLGVDEVGVLGAATVALTAMDEGMISI